MTATSTRKVYFNSTKKCWSLLDPTTRIVDKTKTTFLVLKNVKFKVSQAARQRIINKKKKFVCAFAVGEVADTATPFTQEEGGVNVRFNPYETESFVIASTGEPIHECKKLVMEVRDRKPILTAYLEKQNV